MPDLNETEYRRTLVILTPGFPQNEADTTCLPAQQALVRALHTRFQKLNIIILSFQYPFISNAFYWNGSYVIPLNGRNRGKINRLRTWFRAWRTLKKLKREYDLIGILSFWCTECALIGARFGNKYSIRHFSWILGQDARKNNRFVSRIKPASENLLAMSPFLAEEFRKNHHILPAYIIPNGIDISEYPPLGGRRNIDILAVGSLIPLKQYDSLIRIIQKLTSSIPDITCVICGKGPEEDHLRKMILDADLQNNISLIGEKAHNEVLQWMSNCKLLLHPSSYEGFSTVCLEALYAGAQVISFCDPLAGRPVHWHIVKNETEMTALAHRIIKDPDTDHGRVLLYTADESAKELMSLFHYQVP
jgi:glycosyltransferase involved in cell wall biosynthesis